MSNIDDFAIIAPGSSLYSSCNFSDVTPVPESVDLHQRQLLAREAILQLRGKRRGTSQRRMMMKKTMLLASAAIIGICFIIAHASAQGTPQIVEIAKVDVQKVAAGYRASKVIGSSVLNDANETIGKIDDLLVTRDGKEPYAVLSVGGFLGMGSRMVIVRYDSLKFADKKIVLPGGSKDGLKMLPAFEYSKE
jgi:PRC-barrel domain